MDTVMKGWAGVDLAVLLIFSTVAVSGTAKAQGPDCTSNPDPKDPQRTVDATVGLVGCAAEGVPPIPCVDEACPDPCNQGVPCDTDPDPCKNKAIPCVDGCGFTGIPINAAGKTVVSPYQCGSSWNPPSGNSKTECSTSNNVCATALAAAIVQCRTELGNNICTGAGVMGGHGASPVQLPGAVNWIGKTGCGGDCPQPEDVEFRDDSCSWPGLNEHDGCGTYKDAAHPTSRKILSCVRYSVYTLTSTEAKTVLPEALEITAADPWVEDSSSDSQGCS